MDGKLKRRDMLAVEQLLGKPFGSLFVDVDGVSVATAEATLAMQFVVETRCGTTDLGWDDWLDGDFSGIEVELVGGDDPS